VVVKGNGDIFIMYMIVENQRFDIGGNKNRIISMIEKIRNGGKLDFLDHNIFYAIVTNTGVGAAGISKKMGYRDDASATWKKYFGNSKIFNTDGVWSQRNFNSDKKVKTDGKTYNYYITIDRTDKSNVVLFVNKLMELDNMLRQFSDKRGVAISYKTHAIFDMFLSHNDSLKVYYYDSSLKGDVESIVKKWVNDNNIKLSERSHTHGVDKDGKSYGQIVTDTVLDVLVDIIKRHPNHSNEEYYQWLVKHFIDIIKSIKFK
jgi:hypothetical protein